MKVDRHVLVLIRHAAAEARSEDRPDAERALTPRGRRRFARAARGMERLGLAVDRLCFSPWRRAAETAALLVDLAEEVAVEPRLAAPPDDGLLATVDAPRVAWVGHEPWLGEWVRRLTGAEVELPWKKGGVVVLEGEPVPGGMRLVAVLPPRLLRRAGG